MPRQARSRPTLINIPQPPVPASGRRGRNVSLTFDQWSNYGQDLFRFGNQLRTETKNYQLVCGRWFAAGETYGRARERKATQIGFAVGTLYNWSSVASRIPLQLDSLDLTFEDCRTLATLPDEAQRIEWARRKIAEGWSGRELAARIHEARSLPSNESALVRSTDITGSTSNEFNTTTSSDFTLQAPPATQPRTATNGHGGRFQTLVDEWARAAESLQARGDLALADAYLDCAAQLGELIGG